MVKFDVKDEFNDYRVYRNGMVWSHKRNKEIKQQYDKAGYKVITLCINGKRIFRKVHRLVAKKFISNEHEKPAVNHINGIKCDNRVTNLEWVTAAENGSHAAKLGLTSSQKGEASGMAKLTNEQVLEIRYLYANKNMSKLELGNMFGIARQTCGMIINRKTWDHI